MAGDPDILFACLAERSLVECVDREGGLWTMHDVVRLFVRAQPEIRQADEAHLALARAHVEAHQDPLDWQAMETGMAEVLAAGDRLLGRGMRRALGRSSRARILISISAGDMVSWWSATSISPHVCPRGARPSPPCSATPAFATAPWATSRRPSSTTGARWPSRRSSACSTARLDS
jgi:hypothetical protein